MVAIGTRPRVSANPARGRRLRLRNKREWAFLLGASFTGASIGLKTYLVDGAWLSAALGIALGFTVLTGLPLIAAGRAASKLEEQVKHARNSDHALLLALGGGVILALTYLGLIGFVLLADSVGVFSVGCPWFFGLHWYHLAVAAIVMVIASSLPLLERAKHGCARRRLTHHQSGDLCKTTTV